MPMKEATNISKLVYYPSEIMVMLGISKSACYSFLNEAYERKAPFKVIKINTSIRVPKEGFDIWLKEAC